MCCARTCMCAHPGPNFTWRAGMMHHAKSEQHHKSVKETQTQISFYFTLMHIMVSDLPETRCKGIGSGLCEREKGRGTHNRFPASW
jgi:hypothetical protein